MPNRTIYVSDADLPIFEKAQQLAGDNLSATIVQALRRYVDVQENRTKGFHEITVKVGKATHTHKRFTGRLLAKGHFSSSDEHWHELFEIYETVKGKIALYIRKAPGWWFSGRAGRPDRDRDRDREHRHDRRDWSVFWRGWQGMEEWSDWWTGERQPEYALEVYDKLEDLKERIPSELYQASEQGLKGDSVETLDI